MAEPTTVTDSRPPPDAWVVAMATLPHMGPGRLRAAVRLGEPELTWTRDVVSGRAHRQPALQKKLGKNARAIAEQWAQVAARVDPATLWRAHADAGIGIATLGNPAMPAVLAGDLAPPGVLFWLGDPDVVVGPRVGIVGTRDCTRYGRDIAFELGRDLAAVGVSVVSGLALGIDGAAHAGALAAEGAPPIGVVGTGLDTVYPRQHRRLWQQVVERGVLFSEYPLRTGAEPWHFTSRNRLIAALADVLVVVESHAAGGSMHTVDDAERRQRPVMAVPGPVRSPASAGTNKLLSEGAIVARDVLDVLVELGLKDRPPRAAAEARPPPNAAGQHVLEALGWQPATFEQLVMRSGRSLAEVSASLEQLQRDGWVDGRGGWYERVAKAGARS
ncbi:MAG: DNA-protecting protein DprA [Actinobacteria bacterium]|nr:DNA-protecting protein DprA [Actinomycetota bacterium]